MKSQVLHTVWCYISGEAAGEIWYWSLVVPVPACHLDIQTHAHKHTHTCTNKHTHTLVCEQALLHPQWPTESLLAGYTHTHQNKWWFMIIPSHVQFIVQDKKRWWSTAGVIFHFKSLSCSRFESPSPTSSWWSVSVHFSTHYMSVSQLFKIKI